MKAVIIFFAVLSGYSCNAEGVANRPRPPGDPSALWLPSSAQTDQRARCYDKGFGDLPFTMPDADSNDLTG
jgi:hypothetical protein